MDQCPRIESCQPATEVCSQGHLVVGMSPGPSSGHRMSMCTQKTEDVRAIGIMLVFNLELLYPDLL